MRGVILRGVVALIGLIAALVLDPKRGPLQFYLFASALVLFSVSLLSAGNALDRVIKRK